MSCRVTTIGETEFCMSRHAAARAVEMQITAEEIVALVVNPVERFDSVKYPDSIGLRNDKVSLAMSPCRRTGGAHWVIVTVLPWGTHNWVQMEKDGLLGGRTYDPSRYSRS